MSRTTADWAWQHSANLPRFLTYTSASNVITVDIGSLTAAGQQFAGVRGLGKWLPTLISVAFNAKLDFDDNLDFFWQLEVRMRPITRPTALRRRLYAIGQLAQRLRNDHRDSYKLLHLCPRNR
jgi:hypothetical protein